MCAIPPLDAIRSFEYPNDPKLKLCEYQFLLALRDFRIRLSLSIEELVGTIALRIECFIKLRMSNGTRYIIVL